MSIGNNMSMLQFEEFVQWLKSLYDMSWNFYGHNITLMDVLLLNGFVGVVFIAFNNIMGFHKPQEYFHKYRLNDDGM